MILLTEQFFIFHLIFYWFTCIIYKDNWFHRHIEELGNKIGSNKKIGGLLLDLSMCKFCTDFWLSMIFAYAVADYCNDYNLLIWGVFSTSIIAHFRA